MRLEAIGVISQATGVGDIANGVVDIRPGVRAGDRADVNSVVNEGGLTCDK